MRTKLEASPHTDSRSPDDGSAGFEKLINRFDPVRRLRIRRLVASSPRVADLAVAFPGALHALANRRGSVKRRQKALELVLAGAPLRDVASALDLPLWLRRLPPEAFQDPGETVPRSDIFARRIVNHLPSATEDSAFWLSSIAFGARAADDYFALWLAQQPLFIESGCPQRLFGLLTAYAWFSSTENARGHTLIGVPWRPGMALDTAVCAAKSWLNRMRLVLQLGNGAVTDAWLEAGDARGLSFVPLLDHVSILAEARAMQNCADQYGDRIARDKCRLFSIRRRGVRVATIEIGPHPREAGVLAISQLKGRHNLPATADIWQAAHTWLGAQKDLRRSVSGPPPDRPFDCAAWTQQMAGYRASKGGAPWIPVEPGREAFALIEGGIGELARRAGITSWLFT